MKFLTLLICLHVGLNQALASKGGFWEDEKIAFNDSAKAKKPMLIDFYGIWCPPCNELDETVFETEAFLTKAKSFVLLKIDADAKSSWKIKDRYKVGGYPTLIFTNDKGDEIYRVVGYRTQKEMVRIMDMVLKSKGVDFKKACESNSTADLMRCAISCSERKEIACATTAFEKLQPKTTVGSAEQQIANTFFLEQEKMPDLKRNMQERLMLENPQAPMAYVWGNEYLDSFEEAKGLKPKIELVELVLKNYPATSVSPTMDAVGLTRTDLALLRAELLTKSGKTTEAKIAWKDAAALFSQAAKEVTAGKVARGFTIERIYALEQAGELDEAMALADEYAAKFPKEFTFYFWKASLLYRAKNYLQATTSAYKAFDLSYGDNKIRSAVLLIDILATIPDKATIKKIYDSVKAEAPPEKTLDVRTHRYLKKLDEAYQKTGGKA